MPTERLSTSQLLTILTATAWAKEKLSHRAMFYTTVRTVLIIRGQKHYKGLFPLQGTLSKILQGLE